MEDYATVSPYLIHYPFESKDVEIWIFVHNPDRSSPLPGKVSFLTAIKGALQYDTNNSKTQHLTTIYKETYEEALLKIEGTKHVQ